MPLYSTFSFFLNTIPYATSLSHQSSSSPSVMIPHNQTRQSVKIRRVKELLASQRPRHTLLQLAQQYQQRAPETRLEIAPHPLPTRDWFHYDFVIEDEAMMAAEKRAMEERRARVRENDVDAGGAVIDAVASGADAGDMAHLAAAKRVFQERLL